MNIFITTLFISLVFGAYSLPSSFAIKPKVKIDFNQISQFLINNPSYLKEIDVEKALSYISSIPELQKYVLVSFDGKKSVDWRGLLTDPALKTQMENLMSGKVLKTRFSRQVDFNSFLNFFKPTIANIQNTIQTQTNQLITNTISSMMQLVSNSLFQGAPLDFNKIAESFLVNLKTSILSVLDSQFKFQATQIIDLQFKLMNDLLAKLNNNQIAPAVFVNLLKSNLENLRAQLQQFVPQISDLINNAINKLLLTPLLKPINLG
jgi:hypothetical protein